MSEMMTIYGKEPEFFEHSIVSVQTTYGSNLSSFNIRRATKNKNFQLTAQGLQEQDITQTGSKFLEMHCSFI